MSTISTPTPLSSGSDSGGIGRELPKIEALFLVRFDRKVGYTIAWKRTASSEIVLENGVEYKALPSGLHTQSSDLVYFAHAGYAGLSAFARGEAGAEERNANFVSVGVLARRDGILGRTWGVAARLEGIARAMAHEEEEEDDEEGGTGLLEAFWEEHHTRPQQAHTNPNGGDAPPHAHSSGMPAYHPALSMLSYLDRFGPLVFRLQQAALLRKRILFVGAPPVRAMCEFVYLLSVLSSLSARDAELLTPGAEALLRLPTLFSVGVHDMASLESQAEGGWAACTTDEILATKTSLYDVLVELPCDKTRRPQRPWPRIRTSAGTLIKASQRDVARYKMLYRELFHHRNHLSRPPRYTDNDGLDDGIDNTNDQSLLISRDSIDARRADDEYSEMHDDTMVEPITWSRLAYTAFMWWASAGEKDVNSSTTEREGNGEVLGNLSHANMETCIIAYFHRQTSHLVQTLSQIIEESGEDDEYAEGEGEVVAVGRQEVGRLGLDAWSEADGAFVSEFGEMYMGRAVEVRGDEVDCCGLRVPLL